MPANRRALIGEVAADDPASILGYDAIKTRIGEQHRQQAGRNFNGRKARWKIVTLGEGLECPIENDATRGGVCGCCRTNGDRHWNVLLSILRNSRLARP
jgi:hypothetical protein